MPSHKDRVRQNNCDHRFYMDNNHYYQWPFPLDAAIFGMLYNTKCAFCEIPFNLFAKRHLENHHNA